MGEDLNELLTQIRRCTECADDLPCGPRPIVAAGATARILIIGQAPGIRVHQSGVPWDDPSGNRLREWMGVTSEVFYDQSKVALVGQAAAFVVIVVRDLDNCHDGTKYFLVENVHVGSDTTI